jgi:uncharacterized protein
MTDQTKASVPIMRSRGMGLAALMLLELALLVVVHQFLITFECGATASYATCKFLSSLVARALVMLAAFGVLVWARPQRFAAFVDAAQGHAGRLWMWVHLGGVALLWMPLILTGGQDLQGFFTIAVPLWVTGAVLGTLGGAFWIAPPRAWGQVLRQDRFILVFVLIAAALVPDLSELILPIWNWQVLTAATFDLVYLLLSLFSDQTYADAPAYIIGVGDFAVHIARQCSGVEGVALVTAFVCLYALIFRDQIRFPQYWLVVLPVAVILSLALNIVRIATLVLLGAFVSPEVAVNGFHSYAGWLFFTLLALAIVWGLQTIRWLHRDPALLDRAAPLQQDPVAALILPFVIFMLASVVTQALFPHPALGYPLVTLGLAGATWYFRAQIRALPWGWDPAGWGAGVVVGIVWVALAQDTEAAGPLSEALGALPLTLLVLWVVMRVAGTVLFVPLVEEMFFRGYVMARLDQGGLAMRCLAVAVSTVLFAALHGRWLAAGLAGLVFALVMLRRGRLGDAVQAHLAANLVVALWALARFDFSLI